MDKLSYRSHPNCENIKSILNSCDILINVFEEKEYKVDNEKQNYFNFLKMNRDKNKALIDKIKHFPLYSDKLFNHRMLLNFFECVNFIIQNRDKNIILHCRSGLHRSKMIYDSIYFLENNKHNIHDNMLIANCKGQYNFFDISLNDMEIKLNAFKKKIVIL